jgi:hypothetical protein
MSVRKRAASLFAEAMMSALWGAFPSFKKYTLRSKGKAIPLQAFTSPEGSRRLRLPDFKIIGT